MRSLVTRALVLTGLLSAGLLVACQGAAGPSFGGAPVSQVDVMPASETVTVGQTIQLVATPKDSAGHPLSGRLVTWATGNSGVVAVNGTGLVRSEEHTSELQSLAYLVCRLLLEKKKSIRVRL